MSATRHDVRATSAVSPHERRHFAQAVERPNGCGLWLQVGTSAPITLEWGEAEVIVAVLSALMDDDDDRA